jgi:hypothetical protein
MLKAAAVYRSVIDDVTGDRSFKLRQFELDEDDWTVVKDLLRC